MRCERDATGPDSPIGGARWSGAAAEWPELVSSGLRESLALGEVRRDPGGRPADWRILGAGADWEALGGVPSGGCPAARESGWHAAPLDAVASGRARRAVLHRRGERRVEALALPLGGDRFAWQLLPAGDAPTTGEGGATTAPGPSEAALRESEAQFRASQELAPEAYALLRALRDDAGRVVDFVCDYANPAALRMLGARRDEILGARLLARLPGAQDHPGLFPRFLACLETGPVEAAEFRYDADGLRGWVRSAVVRIDAERVGVWCRDVTARRQAEEHCHLILAELNHRVKNTLAIVQGLARQSFRVAGVDQAARQGFESRLVALASAHGLLVHDNWEAADLETLVREAARAHGREDRFDLSGPAVRLESRLTLNFALAVHELCTNAVKHGALGAEGGRVSVAWDVGEAPERRLRLTWQEQGGPPVRPRATAGFGTRLLERLFAAEPGGRAELDYRPDGLRVRLEFGLPEAGPEPGRGGVAP